MRGSLLEAITGAIVLGAAAFLLVFAYQNGRRSSGDVLFYKVHFECVDGLSVGSDVKVSGVKIGTVHSLELNPQTYLAEVTLRVSKDVSLPKDTSAEIVSISLVGDKYLSLVPGSSEETLSNGEEVMHTQSSISLERLIGQILYEKVPLVEDKAQTAKAN